MKKLFFILLISPFLANGQTGDKNFIDQNYIEVTGKSEIEISPDLIYIKILINEKDNKTKTPLADRENTMISKLKEIGIDINKDLLIKDISSNFKYYWLTKSEILLAKEYQLLVRDGKTASKVYIELENIGISSVSIDRLDNSNIQKYRKEVKIDAIKAAKEKAESLANAIEQNIGRAIYIQELEGTPPTVSNRIVIRGANSISNSSLYGSRAPEPDMDFEKIKLEYSIICRFELK
ncbi:SIMPL domain-containing protein [Belliella marina]|uniref:SIMPL domain-containing protein n=1 Tax=Belliella marina TaxID=1644146 RepID=A0ABW4VIW1_9BACT